MPAPRKVVPNSPLSAADIVLTSCDGYRFGTHCKNIGEFAGGLPLTFHPPNSNGEDVRMDSEPHFVQYIHHHRRPDLSEVPFISLFISIPAFSDLREV